MKRYPLRKRIRLPEEEYAVSGRAFSITICAANRQPLFMKPAYAGVIVESLHAGPLREEAHLFAYCLMPDHLHLLIAAVGGNLAHLLRRWKKYTANRLRQQGHAGPCWQDRFYDHALRREEDLRSVAVYILHNPVRAGLVKEWREYPYVWCEFSL